MFCCFSLINWGQNADSIICLSFSICTLVKQGYDKDILGSTTIYPSFVPSIWIDAKIKVFSFSGSDGDPFVLFCNEFDNMLRHAKSQLGF